VYGKEGFKEGSNKRDARRVFKALSGSIFGSSIDEFLEQLEKMGAVNSATNRSRHVPYENLSFIY